MKNYIKPIVKYLVYFLMVGGIVLLMQLPNSMGQFTEDSFPTGMIIMLVGMFAFWIVFFLTKFDWYDDAEYFDLNAIYIVALICTGLLSIIQIYIRISYGFYNFFNLQFLIPDYENIEKYQSCLVIINFILTGILGFCFFTIRLSDDDVGYKYIEKTTYYTDSGFAYDEKYSDEKNAIGGYILWGVLSVVIPFALTFSPLIFLTFVYFLLKVLKHKNKKALTIKYAVIVSIVALLIVPTVLNTFGVPINIPVNAMLKYEVTEDGESYKVVDVINGKTADRLIIPEKRFGKPIVVGTNALKDLSVTYAKVSTETAKKLPVTVKELVITRGETIGDIILPALKKVTLNKSVTTIDYDAFSNTNLEEIKMGNNVKYIRDRAFYNCKNLKEISIPNSVLSVGEDVFTNCNLLNYTVYDNGLYIGNNDNKHLIFVKIIEEDVKTVKIHKDTAYIHSNAFYKVNKKVPIEQDNRYPVQEVIFESDSNLKQICNEAFANMDELTKIVIPNSVKTIGERAFTNCVALTDVTMPSNLSSLGYSAFNGCKQLVRIDLKGSLTTIPKQCFAYCYKLRMVVVPKSVIRVDNSVFEYSSVANIFSLIPLSENKNITVSNVKFDETNKVSAKIYYYSEERPSSPCNAWRFENGEEDVLVYGFSGG